MKRIFLPFFALLTMFACGDDEDAGHQITYEVLSDSPVWYGEYTDQSKARVCNCTPPLLATDWTYSFRVSAPFEAHIDATVGVGETDKPDTPSITTNIYVDGKLVASNTDNWVKGVASSDYMLER